MNKTIEQWRVWRVSGDTLVDKFVDCRLALRQAIEDIIILNRELWELKNSSVKSKYKITYLDQFGVEQTCVVENIKE